jgi:hypothetical protein
LFGGEPCRANATVQENGKWWCKRHAPSNVAKRGKAKSEQWSARRSWKDRLHNAEREVRAAKDACIDYVRGLAEHGVGRAPHLRDVLNEAEADLEKAKKEKP